MRVRLAAAGPGGETSATTRGMVSFVSLSAQAEEMHSQERQTGSVTVSPQVLWGGAQRAKCALRFFEDEISPSTRTGSGSLWGIFVDWHRRMGAVDPRQPSVHCIPVSIRANKSNTIFRILQHNLPGNAAVAASPERRRPEA